MSKKCIEDFNPWPPFVDIFSSVILVMLLFLMLTLVNLGYYAQFKFKISYTGAVSTENLVLTDNASLLKQDVALEEAIKDQKKLKEKIVELEKKLKKETFNVEDKSQQDEKINEIDNLESAGKKFYEQKDDNQTSLQKFIKEDDKFIITFVDNEIVVDDETIKKLKEFIAEIKEKNPKSIVEISAIDPEKQISLTIAKRTSLSRVLNVRNLIRKLNFDRKNVRINLLNVDDGTNETFRQSGYVIVKIKNDK